MSFKLPEIRIGEGARYESATVFPLFADKIVEPAYRLASDAIADGSVVVKEISESGSVPELMVENNGDQRVLFLEGEELVGAKQNRVLNTSVLVAAKSSLKVPVSCVEQGRWRHSSQHFGSSGSHSSRKLRAIIRKSVSDSAKAKRGHGSDQAAVWEEVAECLKGKNVDSPTSAMSDLFSSMASRIDEFKKQFEYPEGANGLVVTIGDRIAMLDVFDSPDTCKAIWKRILSGIAVDAIETDSESVSFDEKDIGQFVERARSAQLDRTEAVGEGIEYRGELDDGEQATALTFDDAVIHGSVVTNA